MPRRLQLRGRSGDAALEQAIYYVDLVPRTGMTLDEAIIEGRRIDASRKEQASIKTRWMRRRSMALPMEPSRNSMKMYLQWLRFYSNLEQVPHIRDSDQAEAPPGLRSRLEVKVAQLQKLLNRLF